jgi:hypothetical protein
VTITLALPQLAGLFVTITSVLIGIGYVAQKVRKAYGILRAAHSILERELTPNSGKSIKDDSTGMSYAVGWLGRQVDDLADRFDAHMDKHHRGEINP